MVWNWPTCKKPRDWAAGERARGVGRFRMERAELATFERELRPFLRIDWVCEAI
jgi:hypothetical protein